MKRCARNAIVGSSSMASFTITNVSPETEAIPMSASSESRRRFASLTAWRASCARTGTCA
jgi:hypothetical protein